MLLMYFTFMTITFLPQKRHKKNTLTKRKCDATNKDK